LKFLSYRSATCLVRVKDILLFVTIVKGVVSLISLNRGRPLICLS
jgi:hypothetical protein